MSMRVVLNNERKDVREGKDMVHNLLIKFLVYYDLSLNIEQAFKENQNMQSG